MPFYERNDLKGRYYFTFAGLILGFIVGLLIANWVEPKYSKYFLFGLMLAGMLLGRFLTYWVDKKWDMDVWFVPTYRSPDLDDFQDRFIDKTKDINILENLTRFTDYELIVLIAYRYSDLLETTKSLIKDEISRRELGKEQFQILFEQIKVFDFRKYGICPKCGYEKYSVKTPADKLNCVLCGYNDNVDNPNLFLNRLNKLFGYYDDKKLDWISIEKLLLQCGTPR